MKEGGGLVGLRKADKRRGDDVTLSRYVKDEAPVVRRAPRKQWPLPGLEKPNASIDAGRSLFHRKGVTAPGDHKLVLVSGHNNVKIGRDVRKGRLFRDYWIYTLSLEERATCPKTCHHWRTCYGNNMPYAKRVDHREPLALEAAIHRSVSALLATRGRAGILVRLHALGDFFDADYVDFWAGMLATHERLAVYGYTAWPMDSAIGRAIDQAKTEFGRRFAIRWSNGGGERDCTVPIRDSSQAGDAFVCPEQTGRTAACATCGLCWNSERNVAFLEH